MFILVFLMQMCLQTAQHIFTKPLHQTNICVCVQTLLRVNRDFFHSAQLKPLIAPTRVGCNSPCEDLKNWHKLKNEKEYLLIIKT